MVTITWKILHYYYILFELGKKPLSVIHTFNENKINVKIFHITTAIIIIIIQLYYLGQHSTGT